MDYQTFIGIDMGKQSFHCCLYNQEKKLASFEVSNTQDGLKRLEKELEEHQIAMKHALFCVENTGIYCNILLDWVTKQGYQIWVENPLAIKKSMGLQRGKSDPIDAERIAQYAMRFVDRAKLWKASREAVKEIKELLRMRERLIDARKKLSVPIKESKQFSSGKQHKIIAQSCRQSLKALEEDITKLEQCIVRLVEEDAELKELHSVVRSVKGIGTITSLELIIASNEFKAITTAKACACYAGVAPFEHSSGTSIRGKTRVSHFANKRLKSLMHMSAMSAVRVKGELRDYYERKVKEGKSKMLVLNAVRNKLLHRVYSCVRDMRPYSAEYLPQAA